MDRFVKDILVHIFGYLSTTRDLCSIALVCKHWNHIAELDAIWARKSEEIGVQADGRTSLKCLVKEFVTNQICIEQVHCSVCRTLLFPNAVVNVDVIYKCCGCKNYFCRTDRPIKSKPVHPGTVRKLNISGVLGEGSSQNVEVAMVEEHDEPTKAYTSYCTICIEETVIIELSSWNDCKRCRSAFHDAEFPCVYHPGKHELPLDSNGKPCYGITLIDVGGMMNICNVSPYFYTGRWTCCGRLCYHSFAQCPLSDGGFITPYSANELPGLGCRSTEHDPHYNHTEQVLFPNLPNISTGVWKGVGRGTEPLEWRSKVFWNVAVPHHYPCGALCPPSVVQEGQPPEHYI